jgi:hypothetical protein
MNWKGIPIRFGEPFLCGSAALSLARILDNKPLSEKEKFDDKYSLESLKRHIREFVGEQNKEYKMAPEKLPRRVPKEELSDWENLLDILIDRYDNECTDLTKEQKTLINNLGEWLIKEYLPYSEIMNKYGVWTQ